jgi:hypothetical protein
VLDQNPVDQAHDVSNNPVSWETMTGEATVQSDQVTFGYSVLMLIAKRRWQRSNQPEQTFPAGFDMGAVLNVVWRPETRRGFVVALIE